MANYKARKPPFNENIHYWLFWMEYDYHHVEESFEDDGNAESGPHLSGYPAYDEYRNDEEYLIIDYFGHFVHREKRDLEFEKFLEEM